MSQAAQGIKPVVLELGGKNPMIVFPDADLGRAVEDAMEGIFDNCGQVCSAASRLVLHNKISKEFINRLREKASRLSVGPGMQDPDIGPLVSNEHFQRVMEYVKSGVLDGARLVFGGQRPKELEQGFFMEPTIFDRANTDMRIAREEVFGPVIVTLEFEEDAQAVRIANGVSYGLVAGVYTRDITRALRLAQQINAGSVWINGWYLGGVQAPVGGYKDSGFGRERGLAGIHNYLQVKNVAIRL